MARRALIEALILNKTFRMSLNRTSVQTPVPYSRYINNKFGSTVIDGSTGEWLTLNEKINTYPSARRFTAIGSGGDDFVRSMGYVHKRVSSGGKYVSVNIGPVRVISKEQVQAVYNAMRSDDWMKFFL
ncbi:uncharacterized protein LOC143569875 [Bidens hawaiensis]|uniref:uncharacterized protein LOC143569875 n=1 Tax=Bidens hawaiensis TaxID=980011 RepID=UPI00404A78A3